MPSLVDLQKTPQSDNATWEAILVNRAVDTNLLKLEQRAMEIAAKSRSETLAFVGSDLVRQLAVLVSDYMGGPVGNPEITVKAWRSLDYGLKAALGSMVLPLGSLTIGLAHHRALLFKVHAYFDFVQFFISLGWNLIQKMKNMKTSVQLLAYTYMYRLLS